MDYYVFNDEVPVDYDELEQDASDHTFQIHEATGDTDVMVGINPNGRYDFEIWIDGGRIGDKAQYFSDFDELRSVVKDLYPESNEKWEDLGW